MDSVCSSVYDFNAKLLNISNNLGEQEVSLLVFLCKDYIPNPSIIEDCQDLFKKLRERMLMETNNTFILQELLYYIGRYDLLHDYLDTGKSQVEEKIKDPGRTHISPFRCLLLDLLQSNLEDKMKEIKEFLKKDINESELGKVTNMMEVFLLMENSGVLSQDNVGSLKAALHGIKCNQKLLLLVEKFEKEYQESNIENASGKELETSKKVKNLMNTNPNSATTADYYITGYSDVFNRKLVQQTFELEAYELKSNPHGWCLTINNCNFSKARSLKHPMDDRKGSDKDADEIRKVFTSRGYTTVRHDNLEGKEMLNVIKRYADKNHENNDSFVCFILSHGGFGVIYGTDGYEMPIRKLIRCFDNQHCKSLIGKPKIFFVQACRGEVTQKPVHKSDASASEYECDSLPYHSDFLTAYATVEEYKAIRDPEKGSIYIQELCAALNDSKLYCTELQTILTMVQNNISKPEYCLKELVDKKLQKVLAKQMASFQSELCKSLILPAPSQITANTLDRTADFKQSSCNCV